MPFTCLIYVSEATGNITETVGAILNASEKNNPRDHITGILCSDTRYFMQYLEGPDAQVTALYARIVQDSRHTNCKLVIRFETESRNFAGWSMGHIGNTPEATELIEKYMGNQPFNPYRLNADQAMTLLRELATTLPSQTAPVLPLSPTG